MLIEAALVSIVVLLGAAMAALGLACAVMAVRTVTTDVARWRESRRSRTWHAVEGRIERAVVTRQGHGRRTTWGARVRYSFQVGGASRSGSRLRFATSLGQYDWDADRARADVAKHAPGTAVTVFFDPEAPDRAVLERNRIGLASGLALAALLLLAAFVLGGAGVHVLLGPFQEPPDFAPEELPSLAAQTGGFLFLLALVFAVVGATAARRARAQRELRLLVDGARESGGGSGGGKGVAVFGRAEAAGAIPLSAPPHGLPALAWRVRAVAAGVVVLEDQGGSDFTISSEHGPVRVRGGDARCELPRTRTLDDEAARDWVDEAWVGRDVPAPGTFFVESAILAPGDPVLAVGRLRVHGDGRATMSGDGDDAPLLLAAGPLAVLRQRLAAAGRRARICAWLTGCFVAGGAALLLC